MTRTFRALLCSISVALSFPANSSSQLTLVSAHSVAGSETMNLSGLDDCGGVLLTVSDKVQNTIYKLESDEGHFDLKPHHHFSTPDHDFSRPLLRTVYAFLRKLVGQSATDWEGISCTAGTTALISEMYGSILIIGNEQQPFWVSVADEMLTNRLQIYQHPFIGFESISIAGKNRFLIGHERNPASLFSLDLAHPSNDPQGKVFPVKDIQGYTEPRGASNDISGSDVHAGVLYTLHRSARQVCAQSVGALFTQFFGCQSFSSVAHARQYAYSSMTYGRAEGLAVREGQIYIIFDNNNDERLSDGSSEALLFEFENPWIQAKSETD